MRRNAIGKTKIVATIGPSSSKPAMIRKLVRQGMDVARLNFSHGAHDQHQRVINTLRSPGISSRVAVLLDLSGPKIRIGTIKEPRLVKKGSTITLTTRKVEGETLFPISYKKLPREISPGDPILLNDGAVRLKTLSIDGPDIHCKVLNKGVISSHKGINLPKTVLSVPSLTKKDRADLAFGLKNNVDFIALSFVRSADDILKLKRLIARAGKEVPVIAKIEKREAIENLEAIIDAADGAMVARGDLGVEINFEQVPLMQKNIIALCNRLGKPVITATQMFESMIENPRPTRAEVTDVANAINEGTDAVMLSAETAVGRYPARAVKTMNDIALFTEQNMVKDVPFEKRNLSNEVADGVCHAVSILEHDLNIKAIVTCTISGATARMVARYRPMAPILAPTPNESAARRLHLTWGVIPVKVKKYYSVKEMQQHTLSIIREKGLLKKGERIIIVAGLATGPSGGVNHISVVTI
jgi:pyruvate kinase